MNKGMKNHVMKAAACFLVGSMTIGCSGMGVMAAGTPLAGLEAKTAKKAVVAKTEETVEETAEVDAEETAEPVEQYVPIAEVINTAAVAQTDDYINIRSNASEESEIIGKMYNNNVATILGDEGEWYYVQSGNCEGYVAKYLLTTGSEAASIVSEVGTQVAQVNAEGLMVRTSPEEGSDVIGMVSENDIVYLEEDLGGWAMVTTADGVTGYVNADYVSYATYLPQAESAEEEAARIEAEEAAYEAWLYEQEQLYLEALAQQQAEWEAMNQGVYVDDAQVEADQAYAEQAYAEQAYAEQLAADAQAAADAAAMSGDEQAYLDAQAYADQMAANAEYQAQVAAEAQETADTTSSLRQQIVDYALQFVGNPYVYGGTSLTNGTDCSGFTQSVLRDNGISVNRTAGQQAQGGKSVSLDSLQPGDLLFYEGSGDYGIGHVTMYIGDGKVVHASSSTTGIIVSDVDYRTPCSAKNYID